VVDEGLVGSGPGSEGVKGPGQVIGGFANEGRRAFRQPWGWRRGRRGLLWRSVPEPAEFLLVLGKPGVDDDSPIKAVTQAVLADHLLDLPKGGELLVPRDQAIGALLLPMKGADQQAAMLVHFEELPLADKEFPRQTGKNVGHPTVDGGLVGPGQSLSSIFISFPLFSGCIRGVH